MRLIVAIVGAKAQKIARQARLDTDRAEKTGYTEVYSELGQREPAQGVIGDLLIAWSNGITGGLDNELLDPGHAPVE